MFNALFQILGATSPHQSSVSLTAVPLTWKKTFSSWPLTPSTAQGPSSSLPLLRARAAYLTASKSLALAHVSLISLGNTPSILFPINSLQALKQLARKILQVEERPWYLCHSAYSSGNTASCLVEAFQMALKGRAGTLPVPYGLGEEAHVTTIALSKDICFHSFSFHLQ